MADASNHDIEMWLVRVQLIAKGRQQRRYEILTVSISQAPDLTNRVSLHRLAVYRAYFRHIEDQIGILFCTVRIALDVVQKFLGEKERVFYNIRKKCILFVIYPESNQIQNKNQFKKSESERERSSHFGLWFLPSPRVTSSHDIRQS